jgi:hypothetical protein
VDGNYHSARRLPELTSRSVERLEGAKFRGVDGLGSLQQFVGNPEKYNLKFIFSNDAFYDPLLWSYGWNRLGELDNNVIVWERADISPLPLVETRNEIPGWQRAMWGILPPVALVAAAAAFVRILFGTSTTVPAVKTTRRGPVDRWLLRQTEVLRTVPRDGTRRPLLRWDPASLLPHPRRQLRIAAAVCVLGVAGAGFMVLNQAEATPEDAITSYYDRLDFQEYDKAWQALNPADRAPLAEYLKIYPDSIPPAFEFEDHPEGLVVQYRSARNLPALAEGLLSGVSLLFDEDVAVTALEPSATAVPRFLVVTSPR